MRELKFRAWEKPNKYRNPYGHMLQWEQMTPALLKDDSGDWIIMQFTGLLDKNGKEIYEGDIVRVWSNERSAESSVFFKDGSFLVKFYAVETLLSRQEETRRLIIGNIYENADLLKG